MLSCRQGTPLSQPPSHSRAASTPAAAAAKRAAECHRGARGVAWRSRHRRRHRGGRAARTPADAAARRERRASSRSARCGVAQPPPLPSPRRPSSKPAGRRCRQARTPSVIGERAARRGEAATIAAASTQLSSKHAGCRCRQARSRASSESARCGVAKPPLVPSPKQPSSKHAGRQARDRPPPAARGMARPRRHRCHRRVTAEVVA